MPLFGKAKASLKSKDSKSSLKSKTPEPDSDSSGDDSGDDSEEDDPEVYTLGRTYYDDNKPSFFQIKQHVIKIVACGGEHSAIITDKRQLFTFGKNNMGQLGHGNAKKYTTPHMVKALKGIDLDLVACGNQHTLVTTVEGGMYAFGNNNECQLGTGDDDQKDTPELLSFGKKFKETWVSVDAGTDHSVALTAKGTLFVWGSNAEGQLGLQKKIKDEKVPHKNTNVKHLTSIACGNYHTAFINNAQELFMCGEAENGRLGIDTEEEYIFKPVKVKLSHPALKVSCGSYHTSVTTKKHVYVTGSNTSGQLGLGKAVSECSEFRQMDMPMLDDCSDMIPKSISCGDDHTMMVMANGEVTGFGSNRNDTLGLGDAPNQFGAVVIASMAGKCDAQSVACGGTHSLVLGFAWSPDDEEDDEDEDEDEDEDVAAKAKAAAKAKEKEEEKGEAIEEGAGGTEAGLSAKDASAKKEKKTATPEKDIEQKTKKGKKKAKRGGDSGNDGAGAGADIDADDVASTYSGTDAEHKAATKLQANFRGYKCRKRFSVSFSPTKGDQPAAAAQDKHAHKHAHKHTHDIKGTDEEHKAATKVQAHVRGHQARKRFSSKKEKGAATVNKADHDDNDEPQTPVKAKEGTAMAVDNALSSDDDGGSGAAAAAPLPVPAARSLPPVLPTLRGAPPPVAAPRSPKSKRKAVAVPPLPVAAAAVVPPPSHPEVVMRSSAKAGAGSKARQSYRNSRLVSPPHAGASPFGQLPSGMASLKSTLTSLDLPKLNMPKPAEPTGADMGIEIDSTTDEEDSDSDGGSHAQPAPAPRRRGGGKEIEVRVGVGLSADRSKFSDDSLTADLSGESDEGGGGGRRGNRAVGSSGGGGGGGGGGASKADSESAENQKLQDKIAQMEKLLEKQAGMMDKLMASTTSEADAAAVVAAGDAAHAKAETPSKKKKKKKHKDSDDDDSTDSDSDTDGSDDAEEVEDTTPKKKKPKKKKTKKKGSKKTKPKKKGSKKKGKGGDDSSDADSDDGDESGTSDEEDSSDDSDAEDEDDGGKVKAKKGKDGKNKESKSCAIL